MNNLYDILEAREQRKIKLWKWFKPHQKHFALMYIYRLKTDFEHIFDYMETFEWRKLDITPDDLPDYISKMSPADLRREAYEVIGQLSSLPQEPA